MKTSKIHPNVCRSQQFRKKLFRSCKKKVPHNSRKWWKAWHKTWEAMHPIKVEHKTWII